MTIALARDVEAFLQEQVRAGACTDPAELVNDVLRSLSQQQHKPFKVTPELEAWLLAAADKPATALTEKDFVAIRALSITTTRRGAPTALERGL